MAWFDPRTWTTGETVTAAFMNGIRDSLKAIGDARTSYTPTWTGSVTSPTLGNGSITGRYRQTGKQIDFTIGVVFGSTTTVGSSTYTFGLPSDFPTLTTITRAAIGVATAHDVSTVATRTMTVAYWTTTRVVLHLDDGTAVTHAAPFAWAAGDTISISGSYETA